MLELVVFAIPIVFIGSLVGLVVLGARLSGRAPQPPRKGSRAIGAWVGAFAAASLLGLVAGIVGAAIYPLSDLELGRPIAAPVVCPSGGVPDGLHYRAGNARNRGSSWNVVCQERAHTRRAPDDPGEIPGCRLPTFTTALLSFEVYGGLTHLIATLALGLLWPRRRS